MGKKKLLIGPSQTGKTSRILDDFEQSLRQSQNPLGKNFYFVLPSAEHTERVISLVLQKGVPGFFYRRVTTLSRLIPELFGIYEQDVAGNVTRFLILRELCAKNKWPYFEQVQQSPGFLNLILGLITELKESLIPPAVFRERTKSLKKLEPDLALKYEALANLYEQYEAALTAQGLRDRADSFRLYEERKKQKNFKKPVIQKIWLDGFFDFTEVQLAYVCELSEMADEMTVTLTLDPDPSRAALFENIAQTQKKLVAAGFEVETLSRQSRESVPTFDHLERHLFSGKKLSKKPDAETQIAVFEAIGMEGEIEMIARSILKIQRLEGCRFSDFAVLLRRIGDYESVIRSVFRRYQIPVEIHERERLEFAPMIRTIVRLLAVFQDGWKRSDVIEFLKSSYVRTLGKESKTYEWVGELEHRAIRKGVLTDSKRWLEPWEDDKNFDTGKTEKLRCLAELEVSLRQATSIAEIKILLIRAIRETFGICQIADQADEPVRRDAMSYRHFVSLLDEIEASFAEGMPAAEHLLELFLERFFRLAKLDLYSLHELDTNRVQVYDVSLARQKEYRVVFVAGLLEKRFPVLIKEDAVFSDWERSLFNGNEQEGVLQERLPRQAMERYLFYLAVTRAREKLILTFPLLDLEGKESLPSYYIEEVRKLYGNITEKRQRLGRPYPELEDVATPRELEAAVMGELWNTKKMPPERKNLLYYLTNSLLETAESKTRFMRAFYRTREELTDSAIRDTGIFRPLVTSASSLEEHAKCAFRYYAHKVLKLFAPEEDINVMRRGSILHDALENFFRERKEHPEKFSTRKKTMEIALNFLDKAFQVYPLLIEKKYQFDLEREDARVIYTEFLEQELARLETSPLQPAYFEYAFGTDKKDSPAFEIKDGNRTIQVRGKIDRIDTDPDGKTGLVLDYKRTAEFKRKQLELGVALQLPIYLMVMEKYLGLKPAGAELYSIKEKKKSGFYHADAGLDTKGKRMVLEEKEYRAVLDRSTVFIKKFSQDMEAMKIQVKPRVCEDYCPYSPVCRIEKWRLPEILEEIVKEDEKTFA